jgi:hypothetical protein
MAKQWFKNELCRLADLKTGRYKGEERDASNKAGPVRLPAYRPTTNFFKLGIGF